MKKNTNIFGNSMFRHYSESKHYSTLIQVVKTECRIAEDQYEILKIQSEDYLTENNRDVKEELEAHYKDENHELKERLIKFCLFDYIDKIRQKMLNKTDNKKILEHLVLVLDGYHRKKVFVFNEKEETGFDFEKYEEKIEREDEIYLDKCIEKSLEGLFK